MLIIWLVMFRMWRCFILPNKSSFRLNASSYGLTYFPIPPELKTNPLLDRMRQSIGRTCKQKQDKQQAGNRSEMSAEALSFCPRLLLYQPSHPSWAYSKKCVMMHLSPDFVCIESISMKCRQEMQQGMAMRIFLVYKLVITILQPMGWQ